jgi:UDP-glucose 4-epimerase
MNGSDAVKRIAVIGARGFIGNNLVNALKKEDYDVIDLPDVDICILETLNLKDVDLVYHLAAYPLTNCKKNYHDCIKTNILGTINLMEAVKKYKIKRVIYSSASSVYGNPMSLPVHEDAQKTPLTLYGVCKLASEQIIHYYFQDYFGTYGIFRFSNIYGPGQKNGLIPIVIGSILAGKEISITGDGTQTRDFVYVDDVVKILMKAIVHPLCCYTVNLGSGKNVSVNEVVNICAASLDRKPKIVYEQNPSDLDRKYFQTSLDKLQLIYGPLHFISFQDGIRKTIESMKIVK